MESSEQEKKFVGLLSSIIEKLAAGEYELLSISVKPITYEYRNEQGFLAIDVTDACEYSFIVRPRKK